MASEEAVGAAYDAAAEAYTARFADTITTDVAERALIDRFGELCRAAGTGTIVDLGCGPGRIAARLAGNGLPVTGVDASAEMIRIARARVPEVEFRVGSMTSFLRERPGAVGHALFWFSAIHSAPDELAALLSTTFAALRPGGYVLLGFQSMDDPAAPDEPYDHRVAAAHRYSLAGIRRLLLGAGFTVLELGLRAAGPDERVPTAHALARRAQMPSATV